MNSIRAVGSMILIFFSMVCAPPVKEDPIKTLGGNLLYDAENLIKMLGSDNIFDIKRAIVSLHSMGKPAIPKLIEKIDDPSFALVMILSPRLSHLEKEDLELRRGFLAAYLIEWILALDDINPDNIMKSPFLLGDDDRKYIYPAGRIIIEGRRALAEDLIVIKGLYQEWWRRNSSKELSELRLEWKQGIRPLSGTAYSWGWAILDRVVSTHVPSKNCAEIVQTLAQNSSV